MLNRTISFTVAAGLVLGLALAVVHEMAAYVTPVLTLFLRLTRLLLPMVLLVAMAIQGYYYFHHYDGGRHARDKFKDNPYYDACVAFCERWDQCAFDPDYDTLPLETFEPMVRRLFAEPRQKFV